MQLAVRSLCCSAVATVPSSASKLRSPVLQLVPVSHRDWLSCLYIPLTASSMRSSIKNTHSAVWSARWGDLLFELLTDLGSNRVIVHDAVEVFSGGPLVLMSLLTSISWASSRATACILVPLMLHTNPPFSRQCLIFSGRHKTSAKCWGTIFR